MEPLMLLHTIILGIVEGITEFIPVSSTAHLLLTGEALGMPHGAFLEALAIAIQSGAILAAIWHFWHTIWRHTALIGKVALAFLPTAVAGLALYPLIKPLFANPLVMAFALIGGGILLILIPTTDRDAAVSDISARQAFLIGLLQVASFVPGVSRAGATLIGGSLLGIPRSIIVSFSFLLAIPTIIGAGVVEVRHVEGLAAHEWLSIAIAAVVAFVTALLTMRFFIKLLTRKPLSWFGWYRIILGAIVCLIFV